MHNVGLNTSVQSWSKPFVWTFTSVFFFAHTFCFFVGIIVAPQLFSSSSIVGDVCQPQNLSLSNEQGQRDIETKECIALGPVSIPPVPLEDTIISFRFPEPSNEVHSYTHLNWRLLGSLLLELIFEGESNFPQTPKPTTSTDSPTTNANDTEFDIKTEELRLKKIVEDEDDGTWTKYSKEDEEEEEELNSFSLFKESIEVFMHAELMVEKEDIGEDAIDEDEFIESSNASGLLSSEDKVYEYYGSQWVKKHGLDATRELQCTYSHNKPAYRGRGGRPSTNQQDDSNQTKDKILATATYTCTLTPLFDLLLVNSNSSYLVRLRFINPEGVNLKIPKAIEKSIDNKAYNRRYKIEKGQVESNVLNSKAARIQTYLTLITEISQFHTALMIAKCIFTPFVLAALCLFCIRTYQNDLYVAIPDRLLITSAFAVILHNIPFEIFIEYFGESAWSSYLKVVDELVFLAPMVSLMLFWCIFTADKLARNEPWERNTRYYWLPILLVVMSSLVAGLFIVYSSGPVVPSPFNSHWLEGSNAVRVSIGLLFTLAALALTYQTYLAILVFRVLCDISVSYSTATLVLRMWRLKMVLLYSFVVSLLTIGGYVLKLAIQLGLYWNPQFYLEPIPFHLTLASSYLLGLHGMWNLHVIALLIMLSRGPKHAQDYVRAMGYHQQHACSSVDHNGHHSVPCEDCLRGEGGYHYQYHHQQRRQSSEDFLDYHQTRTHMGIQEPLCTGCQINGTELSQIARVCSCQMNEEHMIEMKYLSSDNANGIEDHPITNMVEATNCHHHYIWEGTHASEGDVVYTEDDEMGSNEHHYHDTNHPEDQDSDFRVESADPGVDTDSEEHFLDNSQDETDAFFHSDRDTRGGGRRYGGPMSTGRIER